MREYTASQTVIANLPFIVMLLTGAMIIATVFGFSPRALTAAATYVIYGIGGSIWIMIFICRYCGYYATRGCPCGYGMLAAKLVTKCKNGSFASRFKRHIPVIVPLWIIPVVCVVIALHKSFSHALIWLIGAFALNSFIILPLLSLKHSCIECLQKNDCPWISAGNSLNQKKNTQ